MDRIDTAVALFRQGFSCSQAILTAYGGEYGLDRDTALKIGRAFGTGLALGETCGAVTGALMVLGLGRGELVGEDREARYKTYDAAREFVRRFIRDKGSVVCRELLGLNPGTPEGLREAREKNLFTTRCPGFVEEAARILEAML